MISSATAPSLCYFRIHNGYKAGGGLPPSPGHGARVSSVNLDFDYATMAADPQANGDIEAFRSVVTGLSLVDVKFQDSGTNPFCNVSTGQVLPMVPTGWRRRVFDTLHSLLQPSVRASATLVGAKFVWPVLRKEVRKWAAACLACQWAKEHRQPKSPLEPFSFSKVLQPRLCRSSWAASALPWIYLSPHHGEQDHQMSGGCAPVLYYIIRGGSGSYLHLGSLFWQRIFLLRGVCRSHLNCGQRLPQTWK